MIMIILGIETSCDETAAAVVEVNNGNFIVRSNIISSQIEIHKQYGGVVPEVAARNHIINIIPVIQQALTEAKVTKNDIDRIAVTTHPGLMSSLLVGVQTAKTLALTWNKPLCSVNHLKAHLYAGWLENQPINFPAIGLIVSGGHTELVYMKNEKSFKNIGQTVDDAAGEAFDKVAHMLGLEYPGGPEISRHAERGDVTAFELPRPMHNSGDLMFSFSGLKTAVLYSIKKLNDNLSQQQTSDMAASFQQAVIDVLIDKTKAACQQHEAQTLIVAGGVAANKELRQQLIESITSIPVIFPAINYCTDNAAMIAAAGYFTEPKPLDQVNVTTK